MKVWVIVYGEIKKNKKGEVLLHSLFNLIEILRWFESFANFKLRA